MWRSGKEVSEEEQQKIFLRDFSQDTPPGSSPLDTPTKSGSPDHSDFQEERSKLCSMIEEKVISQSEGQDKCPLYRGCPYFRSPFTRYMFTHILNRMYSR